MNISKHFTKRFRLNFTLNQSSQNAEQHTYSTYIFRKFIVISNNLSTIIGVLYKKYNKNQIYCVCKREPALSVDQLLILHVKSMFGKYMRGVAACMYF